MCRPRPTHNAAEPAGTLALAGLLSERTWAAGKRVAVIQTGGNADADLLLQVLGGTPPRGEPPRHRVKGFARRAPDGVRVAA